MVNLSFGLHREGCEHPKSTSIFEEGNRIVLRKLKDVEVSGLETSPQNLVIKYQSQQDVGFWGEWWGKIEVILAVIYF